MNKHLVPLTLYVPGGGADLPTLTQTHNFFKIPLCRPILRFVDFSCMSITVLLQKTRASYVPRFNFGGLSFKKKFSFQIADFQKKIKKISVFKVEGCAFRFWPFTSKARTLSKKKLKLPSHGNNSKVGRSAPPLVHD